MRQTREIEDSVALSKVAAEQKDRLIDCDETIHKQQRRLEELLEKLKGPAKATAGCQTIDSGMLELEYARQEVLRSQQCQEIVFQENLQLKEAVQRGSYEVCRLIEDKRELEDLIEKLNKSISMFRSQTGVN